MKIISHVLIIDEDRDDVEALSEAVQSILPKCQCSSVKDGLSGLKYLEKNNSPDIVFMELRLRLKNGIECLQEMSMRHLQSNIPIIVWSTSGIAEEVEVTYNNGALFYLVKPTSYKLLREFLIHIISTITKLEGGRVDRANFLLTERAESHLNS